MSETTESGKNPEDIWFPLAYEKRGKKNKTISTLLCSTRRGALFSCQFKSPVVISNGETVRNRILHTYSAVTCPKRMKT